MSLYVVKLKEIVPSFGPRELLSPDGLRQLESGNLMLQEEALSALEQFREKLGVPIKVNHGEMLYRGYRSPPENQRVGGAAFSRHVQGIAFDCSPQGMELERFYEEA